MAVVLCSIISLLGENMFSRTRFGTAAAVLALSFTASAAQADTVNWKGMIGIISDVNVAAGINLLAPNSGIATIPSTNDVGAIKGGTFPWTTNGGNASVDLVTGATSFHVKALNINGTPLTGTAGPVTKVVGTLVCNPTTTPQTFDTAPVDLDPQGDADLTNGKVSVPKSCDKPAFLIRINTLNLGKGPQVLDSADAPWIATGTQPTTGNPDRDR
jgi:hypothetical protein